MPRFEPKETDQLSDLEYQDYILQGVSRTFALTIPQLPPGLREQVGNAYLLCRLADTIEDDPEMPAAGKRDFSERLVRVIDQPEESAALARDLSAAVSEDTPVAEQDLVAHTERVIRLTRSFSEAQRAAMSRCLRIMTQGMAYYQDHPPRQGLEDLPALNDYCYYVAGVVGEMLTQLFCDYLRNHSETAHKSEPEMLRLAVSFGQGLQMTNILKDIWDDKARDICWLPRRVFERRGLSLEQLEAARRSPDFAEGMRELVAIAHGHLRQALEYTLAIPASEPGLRRFCLWCIGLAVMSLRKINRQPGFTAGDQVKISRSTLYTTVWFCNTFAGSDWVLRGLFRVAATGLPLADGRVLAANPPLEQRSL